MKIIKKNTSLVFLVTLISILIMSCQNSISTNEGEYQINNINIYKNTPVWELAKAVKSENRKKIAEITKEYPQLLDYQEPKYGATLLLWAVGMEKYKSAEALLIAGADPNIEATKGFAGTPLFEAAGYSWIDNDAKKDAKYVRLLLQYGADPNKNFITSEVDGFESGMSPLMHSIGTGLEKTKLLVEAGADINHKTPSGSTAAYTALLAGGPNSTLEAMQYAYYLIVEKKANVTDPYYRKKTYGNEDPNEAFYPVNTLRNWVYDLGSEKHKLKMEIVEEFARQGVNYWNTPINRFTLDHIKAFYPDTWEDYIKKY